jgi:hypothetical protein
MEVSNADAVALCSGIRPCAPPSAATGTLHTPNLSKPFRPNKHDQFRGEETAWYLEIARRRREAARGRADAAADPGD